MHSVKYSKWESNIHNRSPEGETVELSPKRVVKLGTSTKRRNDPELKNGNSVKNTIPNQNCYKSTMLHQTRMSSNWYTQLDRMPRTSMLASSRKAHIPFTSFLFQVSLCWGGAEHTFLVMSTTGRVSELVLSSTKFVSGETGLAWWNGWRWRPTMMKKFCRISEWPDG